METPRLDIDANVVRQLGDELITDSEQALLELVKNSYDADSEWCNVVIDTEVVEAITRPVGLDASKNNDSKSSATSDYRGIAHQSNETEELTNEDVGLIGKISIQDNGCGMTLDDIRRGWLTISLSPKREMKKRGEVTPKFERTPLGDKGLGRLGTMRLGDRLVIKTFSSAKEKGYRVELFWNDCQSGRPLSSVPVKIDPLEPSGSTGTTIEISGLNNPSHWKGESQHKSLEMKLSGLISPFKSFENFIIACQVNNRELNLISFPDRFFDTALGRFEFVWDQEELDLSGRVKLGVFEGNDPESFQRHVLPDNGESLLEYLLSHPRMAQFSPRKSSSDKWFIEFSDSYAWGNIATDVYGESQYTDPGPFLGEIYSFKFKGVSDRIQDVAERAKDYIQHVKDLSGIHVYRENFRIRLGEDWLNLGKEWTGGGSYYGLRPKNTIGFFALSSKDNPELIEKSDREGFVGNAAYYGFYAIAEKIKKFANDSLESMRRAYVEFRREHKKKEEQLPQVFTARQGAQEIGQLMAESGKIGAQTKETIENRTRSLKQARTRLKQATKGEQLSANMKNKVKEITNEIDKLLEEFASESEQIQRFLSQFAEKQSYIDIINDRFSQLEDQISEVYETVGLGLVAQALAHEIHPSVDEIGARVKGIRTQLRKQGVRDNQLTEALESIRAHAVMAGKKLSYIDPMLRTFRETKQVIILSEFLTDFLELRKDRFERFSITPSMHCTKDFSIRVNKGRLTQIVDNLARNSEYWLRSEKIQNDSAPLELHIEIASPKLLFWDTGPGVRHGMENACFEIFTTDKPKGQGHGLGLFITKQLLEEQGCLIYLSDERNERGRRFKFVVDLSGMIEE